MTEMHPHASSFRDRHDKERWRFRKAGKTIPLPKQPGHPDFEAAYQAAISGRPIVRAEVQKLSTAAAPRSLRAAWRVATTTDPRWKALDPRSRIVQTSIAERFLTTPIAPGEKLMFGEMPLAGLERRDIKKILADMSNRPHAAQKVLRLLRKLTLVGLEEGWITTDPTYRLTYRPELTGWRAWTNAELDGFEDRWPIGTSARLAYALALYTGQRRSDVAAMAPLDLMNGGINIIQKKTGKALWVPIDPALQEVLDASDLTRETILVTRFGRPFSEKALGMRMQQWTKAAGLAAGCTMHGLRKTRGKLLAEAGATTREIMAILGHDNLEHAELYTREAEQKSLATTGMARLKRRGS